MPASRSPSPAADPPIAAAPGPRAANLIKLYSDAVSHTLKTCNYANFAACFPTPAKHASEAMEVFHGEFVEKLGEHCREHFDAILEERNVVTALNDLDRLVDDARKRKSRAEEQASGGPVQSPVPPHTLPANSLYLSYLIPSIDEHESALKAHLQGLQADNVDLVATVTQQRKEIDMLVSGLETVVADMDASLANLAPEETMALTEETVAVEDQIRVDG